MENKETFDQYVWTIGDSLFRHERNFGIKLDKWKFMLANQPKVPFANETSIPNITFTYNFKSEEAARTALNDLFRMLWSKPYPFDGTEFGKFLICYCD